MGERKIGSRYFRVEPLPAGEAIELYAEMMRVVGPAAGRLPSIIVSAQAEKDQGRVMADVATLAALSDIVSVVGSVGVRTFITRIVSLAQIKRESGSYEPCDLDGDFTGDLPDVIAVCRFVLEEQYRDFFLARKGGGLLGLLLGA